MSSRTVNDYSSLFRKLEKRIDKNFAQQTDFLSKLVQARSDNPSTPAGSPKPKSIEAKTARVIFDKLKQLGLFPRRVGESSLRPNVICFLGPERFRKSLMLNGHMDTVEPMGAWKFEPFSGEILDGRLYGVGALDMKATLSAYVYAVVALVQEAVKLDGRLVLAFVVDERSGSLGGLGTKYLLEKGFVAKAAIIGEPGSNNIAIGHRGGYRFRITTRGASVYTGSLAWERKERGRNAVVDMARIICALQHIELPYKPARAFPGRIPVFTFPTQITGGVAMNTVPDLCVAEGDVRLMPGNSDRQVRMWIEDCLRQECADVGYELEGLVYVPSVEIARTEEVVERLATNATEVLSRRPKITGAGAWNDAWMLITRDIPTVVSFGPDGENAHGADEFVDLASLKDITKIYARTVVDFLGTNRRGKLVEAGNL